MTPVVRRLVVAVATVALAAVAAVPALAVGTDGVELTPLLPKDEDRTPTFVVSDLADAEPAELRVANLTDEPRRIRVFAVSATLVDGSVELGSPGSAPFARLDESLDLGPDEEATVALRLAPRELPADDGYVAVVLEVERSSSLVTQAVSIVRYVRGGTAPLSQVPALIAALLIAVTAGALVRYGRERADG